MPFSPRVIEPVRFRRGLPANMKVPNDLEAHANMTMAHMIRQLNSLSYHAEEIFFNLFESMTDTCNRSSNLGIRLNNLAITLAGQVQEEQLKCEAEVSDFISIHERENITPFNNPLPLEDQFFNKGSAPTEVENHRELCQPVPPFDSFNNLGDMWQDCLKLYSNPEYFLEDEIRKRALIPIEQVDIVTKVPECSSKRLKEARKSVVTISGCDDWDESSFDGDSDDDNAAASLYTPLDLPSVSTTSGYSDYFDIGMNDSSLPINPYVPDLPPPANVGPPPPPLPSGGPPPPPLRTIYTNVSQTTTAYPTFAPLQNLPPSSPSSPVPPPPPLAVSSGTPGPPHPALPSATAPPAVGGGPPPPPPPPPPTPSLSAPTAPRLPKANSGNPPAPRPTPKLDMHNQLMARILARNKDHPSLTADIAKSPVTLAPLPGFTASSLPSPPPPSPGTSGSPPVSPPAPTVPPPVSPQPPTPLASPVSALRPQQGGGPPPPPPPPPTPSASAPPSTALPKAIPGNTASRRCPKLPETDMHGQLMAKILARKRSDEYNN